MRDWKKRSRLPRFHRERARLPGGAAVGVTGVVVRKRNANHRYFPHTRTRERDISRSHDYSIYENDYWERRARVMFSVNRVTSE